MFPLLRKLSLVCVLLGLSSFSVPIFAQVAVIEADPEPKSSPFNLQLSYGYLAHSDFKKSGGDFNRNSFGVRLHAEFSFTQEFTLKNIMAYEYHDYTFSNSSPFQWDDMNRLVYVPLFQWEWSRSWTLMVAPFIQAMLEDGAQVDDAITGGAAVGFNWTSGPDLSLGLLIGAISQIEDDAIVVPIPLINWRMAHHWVLRVGPQHLGPTPGIGGEVAWQLTKELELSSGIQFQRRRFRLDLQSQVAQETVVPIFVKGKWWMFSQGSLEVFASLTTGGELRVENRNGNKITDKDYGNTAYLGGKLNFIF